MTGLQIPHDQWAESAVAACAVASRRGAELAAGRVKPADIWSPRLRAIYVAALTLEDLPDVAEEEIAERERRVSEITGVPLPDIVQMVEDRPVRADSAGGLARRVLDASRRRSVMQLCARVYNELGAGASLSDIAQDLHRLEEALPC